jgi:hypothetical protein
VKPNAKIYSKRVHPKFTLYFFDIYTIYYEIWNLQWTYWKFKSEINSKNLKKLKQCRVGFWPEATAPHGLAAHDGGLVKSVVHASCLAQLTATRQPSWPSDAAHAARPRAGHLPSGVRSSAQRWHWWGSLPDNVLGPGTHPPDAASTGRQRGSNAVAFHGGGRASVNSTNGGVLL